MKKWVCKVCGYVHEGDEAPEFCPLCGVPASEFEEVDEQTAICWLQKALRLTCSNSKGVLRAFLQMPFAGLLKQNFWQQKYKMLQKIKFLRRLL